MVRLSTLLLFTSAVVNVSAQLSPNATYAIDKTRDYFNAALRLQAETNQIGTLSCVQYALNMGPYPKIVPILNGITQTFQSYETIVSFQPRLDASNPADVTASQDIIYFLNAATIEIGAAFDRMTQTGTANLCTVPLLESAIKKALEDLKVVARPFYLSLATFNAPEGITIAGYLMTITGKLKSAIKAYTSPVEV